MDKDFIWLSASIVLILTIIFGGFGILIWVSSCKQAEIYNQQYETNYTCSDFFWASSQINSNTQTIDIKD